MASLSERSRPGRPFRPQMQRRHHPSFTTLPSLPELPKMEAGGEQGDPLPRLRRHLRQGAEPRTLPLQPLLQGGGTAGGCCRDGLGLRCLPSGKWEADGYCWKPSAARGLCHRPPAAEVPAAAARPPSLGVKEKRPEPWHSRGVLGREGAGLRPASPLEMGKKLNKNK